MPEGQNVPSFLVTLLGTECAKVSGVWHRALIGLLNLDAHPQLIPSVSLELLDSSTGQPQQVWRFMDQSRIRIGRADDNDLVIANPYVSRSHAYLEFFDDAWHAIAISSQKLVVNGHRVQSLELTSGTVFHLGPSGSCLRFDVQLPEPTTSDLNSTLCVDPATNPFLQLDRAILSREVSAIEESDFFQNLTKNLQRLRQTRNS